MTAKDRPPAPMVTRTEKGLRPSRAWDAEDLAGDPIGTEYELVKVTRRKPKQHRTYWRALGLVVKSTDRWPTKDKLHEDIKFALGFVEKRANLLTGEIMLVPDSTAFDAMDQDEWQVFMDKAMELIAAECGFDPLAWLEAA